MTQVLKGRVAVVTGAGQGNGRAIARGLAEAGASVAVVDMNKASADAVASEIRASGGTAAAFQLDVCDEARAAEVAAEIGHAFGPVSILVNNAGIYLRGTVVDAEGVARLKRTLDVNVTSIAVMVTAFLDQLRSTRGTIVNLGSSTSFIATPNAAAYGASKGAVKQLTSALAVDLAPFGIRVNAIAPGFMNTPMTQGTQANAEFMAKYCGRVPLGRIGQPEELVGPVVFLASAASSYVTGITMPIDGGYVAT